LADLLTQVLLLFTFFYVSLALRIMTLVTIEQEQKYISNAIKELSS